MPSFLYFPAGATAVLLLLLFLSLSLPSSVSSHDNLQLQSRRNLISTNDREDLFSPISISKSLTKKKPILESLETKNSTKPLKLKKINSTIPSSSRYISTPTAKSKPNKTLSANTKSKFNKTIADIPTLSKAKVNKTSIISKSNTTKLLKPINPLKSNSTKPSVKSNSTKTQQLKSPNSTPKTQKKIDAKYPPPTKAQATPKPISRAQQANRIDLSDTTGDDDDLITEFRDLPSRLQLAIVPDLHKFSTTSNLYLSRTHREIVAGVKPFVGKKYAPSIASAALLVLPLLLVTALFRHLLRNGTSASVHRALLFAQAYLAIYFATLSFTAVAMGLEPLRFFYATSPSAYAWTQAVQTMGYVLYLIAQLISLVIAFSVGEGEGGAVKAVGLAQMLLGLAVGMHYYITVLHRAVSGDAPKANWKVHGIYATCFVVICGLGRADRRKKAYKQNDGADEGKKS